MSFDEELLRGWLRLARCRGLDPRGHRELVELVGGAEVLARPEGRAALIERGLDGARAARLCARPLGRRVERELRQLRRLGWTLTYPDADDYPAALTHLATPPAVLAYRGEGRALGGIGVAIVGSRRPSVYGRQIARELGAELGRRGAVVVSGLARGVDAAAHRGALEAGGLTVAVFGTGPDAVYPREHAALAEEIAAQGALVTEFPPDTPPLPHHFPRRNRIVVGLALAVVVVEGAASSGSMVTARWAAEENRPLLAVPGRVGERGAEGPLLLIRDGAAPCLGVESILAELPEPCRAALDAEEAAQPALPGLDPAGRAVLEALPPREARGLDELLAELPHEPDAVLTALFELELAELVEALPGQRFARRTRA